MKKEEKIAFILLIIVLLIVSIITFLLWRQQEVYYYVPPEKSFIYNDGELQYGIEKHLREAVETEIVKLIKDKNSFIYVDLKDMQLTLYKEGEILRVFPIQAKGAEWFWGETPPGVYSAGFMARLHFSSAARVWMPYAIQYYGNYFIHGWPYDRAGKPLSLGVSGGCIRLRTEDAAVVFEFVKDNMPILIFDEKTASPLPALISTEKEISPPDIKGQSFLVADLDTGEILLNNGAKSEIYAGSSVKEMLALTASDNVDLEKRIIAKTWMFAEGVEEKIIIPGKSYRGYDLLSPLLLQSSNTAALVLSRFLTAEEFVKRMNAKAKGIGMKNTNFADVTGVSEENITTLYDAAKMMRYIKDYRNFILGIGREKEEIFKVLEMKTPENLSRFIFIGVANSLDLGADLENITLWLNDNFNLK